MPITFNCACGKTLRVKDELAGKRVRCPVCNATPTAPAAAPALVVEEPPPPPKPVARPVAKPVARPAAVVEDEDEPRPAKAKKKADEDYELDEDADEKPKKKSAPKWKRKSEEEEEDKEDKDRPSKDKKKKLKKGDKNDPGHFGIEKKILGGGVIGGGIAMLVAVVWFVIGLANDTIFFYPPILFIIGLVALIKGLIGGNEEE